MKALANPGVRMGLVFPVIGVVLTVVGALDPLVGVVPARLVGVAISFSVIWVLARAQSIGPDRLGWTRPRGSLVGAGAVLGLALASGVVFILFLGGWYTIRAVDFSVAALASALVVAATVALFEEALLRSVFFAGVEAVLGTWLTLATSAVFFGLLHAFNPGASVTSTLALVVSAGLLLGAGFALTRDLWFVTALHAGWNFTIGWIWGASVSGNETVTSLASADIDGPALITGGEFGPEAGLPTVALVGAATVVLLTRIIQKRLARPAIWSKNKLEAAPQPPG
jgi:membrane protease YdiL (CAAX protease family)